eukprot:scaffold2962_cov126-Cylindrotheca_fusiformis.AAC.10
MSGCRPIEIWYDRQIIIRILAKRSVFKSHSCQNGHNWDVTSSKYAPTYVRILPPSPTKTSRAKADS